jgi:hypothetical protein
MSEIRYLLSREVDSDSIIAENQKQLEETQVPSFSVDSYTSRTHRCL